MEAFASSRIRCRGPQGGPLPPDSNPTQSANPEPRQTISYGGRLAAWRCSGHKPDWPERRRWQRMGNGYGEPLSMLCNFLGCWEQLLCAFPPREKPAADGLISKTKHVSGEALLANPVFSLSKWSQLCISYETEHSRVQGVSLKCPVCGLGVEPFLRHCSTHRHQPRRFYGTKELPIYHFAVIAYPVILSPTAWEGDRAS